MVMPPARGLSPEPSRCQHHAVEHLELGAKYTSSLYKVPSVFIAIEIGLSQIKSREVKKVTENDWGV
jgi:hypothetical protein